MSRGARWTLGAFAVLIAACFVISAPSKSPLLDFLLPAFCTAIAIACFFKQWRGPAVRFLGAMTLLATVSYLVLELTTEPTKTYTGESGRHWLNAILAIIFFGLPGLYVALHGTYPAWGKGSAAFRNAEPHDKAAPLQDAMEQTDPDHFEQC